MRGNSLFPNRWRVLLWVFPCCLVLPAQILTVDPQKNISFDVAGATAAYSLDASIAEASAENGRVSIAGIIPGKTHIVVISASDVQTFELLVTTPPPHYPPGFAMPIDGQEATQSGDHEARYISSPGQIQDQLDFVKIHGNDRTSVHIVETHLVGPIELGQPRTALSSLSYQVITPRRNITLVDQYVDESPLTLNGAIVRGFHMRQDNWFLHADYSSVFAFQGLFLPTQPELAAGGGYRHSLTESSSVVASYYHFQIPASDTIGHSGDVATLSYRYIPSDKFWLIAEAGISHGIGGAGQLYYQTDRDSLVGHVRFEPMLFASLGTNNLQGFHADASWTRHFTNKFDLTLTFYNNNLALPNLKESTTSSTANLRDQLTPHWYVFGGASTSRLQTNVLLSPVIQNLTLPAGLAFQSKHFGATGQYQFAVTPGQEGGDQFRVSLHSDLGHFSFTGNAEQDTAVPSLSFIPGKAAGLQQELNQLGIRATSVQQVDDLLSSNSFLIAAGYIKGATINLVPALTQFGGTASWVSPGLHPRQVSYSALFNDNHLMQGSTQDVGHTVSYSQNITHSDDVALTCSVFAAQSPGTLWEYTPIFFLSWKHQFQLVPRFIVPGRRGTISGNIFQDDESKGVWEQGMRPMSEVEVELDDRRHTITGTDGSYRFPGVPRGTHRIAVIYRSKDPYFFTTASDVEADEDATVNFGIGHSLSGLMGQVVNDAGQGVAGVIVVIRNGDSKWSAATEADGSIFVARLAAGMYNVQLDEDSLPMGYSTKGLVESQQVAVGASSPGKATFTIRAFRSISGRVLSYDSKLGQYVPVIGALLTVKDRRLTSVTDPAGRYLFQDLAAGSYTISAQNTTQSSTRTLRLGAQPVALTNVDFQTGASRLPEILAPEEPPDNP